MHCVHSHAMSAGHGMRLARATATPSSKRVRARQQCGAMFISKQFLRDIPLNVELPKQVQQRYKAEQAVARYFQQVWNECDVDVLEEIMESDVEFVDPCVWHEPYHGRERLTKVVEEYLSAFKTFNYTILQLLSTSDASTVMVRWKATAVHLGTFLQRPASGATQEIHGMTTFHMNGDKIRSIECFRQPLSTETSGVHADYGY